MAVRKDFEAKGINLLKLKKQPKKYVKDLSIKQLDTLIRLSNEAYYEKSKPFIPDMVYDIVKDELANRNPNHPTLKKVGHPVTKNKVKLPHYMGSLDKIKPDNADKWLSKNKGPYLVSEKLDGASLELIGSKKSWLHLYTRGKGTIGKDATNLIPHLKLPKPKDIDVRLEIAMSKSNFKHFEEEYENARNLTSSLGTAKKVNIKAIKRSDIIAHEILRPAGLKPSRQYSILKKLGFNVPQHKVFKELTANKLNSIFEKRRESAKFTIDGLVIALDKPYKPVKSGNPKYMVSFKSYYADQIAVTKVITVEWNKSKYGLLKPRIELEPVRVSGVTIKFVTGNNARYIVENGLGPGAVVEILRSGDVIPKIIKVKRRVKPQLPAIPYIWDENEVDIHLKDKKSDPVVHAKKVNSFFRAIGVEFFSQKLVQRFIESGLNSIFKIVSAPKSAFLKVPGVKEKLATKIRNNIDSAINGIEMSTLMYASGKFPKDMGTKRFKAILKKYPDIIKKDYPTNLLIDMIIQIPGFSNKIANRFVEGLPKFRKFLATMPSNIKVITKKEPKKSSNRLSDITVVFTGFRDKELIKKIESNGGTVGSGVNKNTSILLVEDLNVDSTKAKKARELGIKIMTPNIFRKKYGI